MHDVRGEGGEAARQLVLPFVHRSSLTRASFLPAPCNAEALAWLDQPHWPDGRLALWGDSGSGKSHLLEVWAREQGGLRLEGATLRGLVALDASKRAIALDDADLVPDEHDLLHLLNMARDRAARLLLTGRRPPSRWRPGLPDLDSRLRATAAVGLGRPDDALLRDLLLRLLAERQLAVPASVVDWLLPRLTRSPAAMHEAAMRLDRAAFGRGGAVTRSLAALVLDAWGAAEEGLADLAADDVPPNQGSLPGVGRRPGDGFHDGPVK